MDNVCVNLQCNVLCGVSKKTGKNYVALVYDLGYRTIFISFGLRDVAEIVGISPALLQDVVLSTSLSLKAGEFRDITSDVIPH